METKSIALKRSIKTHHLSNISNDFLDRIEHQRRHCECLRSLDLRPYATEPCKHFSYRGRSLWLDPEAHRLFLEALEKNAGVFTVETYESLLKRFVDKVVHPGQTAQGEQHCERDGEPQTKAVTITYTTFELNLTENDLAIDLSYFDKRVCERFKIALYMELIWNGQTYPAETRDVSHTGLLLRIKVPIELSENDVVRVNVRPSADWAYDQHELNYRVVRIRRLLNDTLIALQCIEKEEKAGMLTISEHIATSTETEVTKQRDPKDALLTAQAMLAERFYMRSTSILPFFIFERHDSDSPLRIIFANQVNHRSLAAFETSPGKYDFSSLVTQKRLKLLTRLALRDSQADTLLAVYRPHVHDSPQVRADLECKNHKHWRRLLKRYANQPDFRVFKVVARIARQPVDMKIEHALEPLTVKGHEFAQQLLMDANTLSIVGALIDVTEQVHHWPQKHDDFNHSADEEPVIFCDNEQPLPPPQLLPIHYIQENRREDRFLGKMQVEFNIAGWTFQGVTRDVSAHGLSVQVDDPYISFINTRQATISFPKLEGRSSRLGHIAGTFLNVPAELVERPVDGEQLLRFKITEDARGHRFITAFSAFLAKRQSNLSLDASHTLRAVTSRLYSSIFIESSPTLPLFIYRRSLHDWNFRLGITTSPAPLIDYFEVSDGKFDVSVLASNGRLQRLMQEVSKAGYSELTLYLCKERRGDAALFDIRSLAEFEITDEAARHEFINYAMEHDFRCLKLILNQPSVLPKAEFEQAIERLVELSPRRSECLKSDFLNLIAIGDVVDITGLVVDVWSKN
jgi:hypothetical protein